MSNSAPSERHVGRPRERELGSETYSSDNYLSADVIHSLGEQIEFLARYRDKSILEIGVGNRLVSTFLKLHGFQLKTCDINPALEPDIQADITQLRNYVSPNEFYLCSACEVLEHLPFSDFERVLDEFAPLFEEVFITLPLSTRHLFEVRFEIKAAGLWKLTRFLNGRGFALPLRIARGRVSNVHCWEINSSRATSMENIRKAFRRHFTITAEWSLKSFSYMRAFHLTRTSRNGGAK